MTPKSILRTVEEDDFGTDMAAIEIVLGLSLLAGLSTSVGGLIAYFIGDRNVSYLLVITGFAAGVMIYISFVELLAEAIEGLGFLWSNIYFFLGIILLFLIDRFIPHAHEDMCIDSYGKEGEKH